MDRNSNAPKGGSKEAGLASFSTRTSRNPSLPSNLKAPKTPQILKKRKAKLTLLILVCFLFGLGGGLLGAKIYSDNNTLSSSSIAAKQKYISNESDLISSIAKSAGQSVVSVEVISQAATADIFGLGGGQSSQESAGTGFIVSSKGIIVTNRHVVPAGTSKVSITLADGTRYDDVQVIGRTNESSPLDVAFLKITDLKGKTLSPVNLGDSTKVEVGDRVIAIGNALGQFQNSVTSGIISGYGRDLTAGDRSGGNTENLTDLFQTDAAINEGNSGGPLVNINGEVIGVNTAIAGSAQNIGFSIPINDIKGLIEGVLAKGELKQPYIGVRYVSLTNDLASQFNLKQTRGAYINSSNDQPAIVSGSPAEKAGLREKDIILKVNSITIDDKTNLTTAVSRFKVGDSVKLTLVRDGKTIEKTVTLAEAPQS